MILKSSQKEKFCQFLHRTLIDIAKVCPEISVQGDSLLIKTNDTILLSSTTKDLTSPYGEIIETLFSQPSDLIDEDEYLSSVQLSNLLTALTKKGKIIRLNHLGFIYKTDNVQESIRSICKISKENKLSSYKQESDDIAPWIFIGHTQIWREPMVEFVPIKSKYSSPDMSYWIPELHINIDTTLSYKEISDAVGVTLQGLRTITPTYFGGFISQARVWVGVVSGINIHIDIATYAQNTRFTRKVLYKQIY